jgi:Domain of unknown function (DUF4276)
MAEERHRRGADAVKELYVFCEGQTEQGFCTQVLQPHLFPDYDGSVRTILIAHSRRHGVIHRGGIGKYATLRGDILNTIKRRASADVRFTTMIDLYKSPVDFPGKPAIALDPTNPTSYVEALEDAFREDIGDIRFVPYLQLFEYETLLFSDPEGFRIFFDDCDKAIESLKEIAASVSSLEHIDDGEATAPSKRIIALLPGYKGSKTTAGPDIATIIGIDVLRAKCPHFGAWIARLETAWDAGASVS